MTTHDLVGAEGEAVEVWVPPGGSPDGVAPSPVNSPPSAPTLTHAQTCPVPCCTSADDPAVTGRPAPFTAEGFDDLLATVWADLDTDPRRFDDLLANAIGFIGGIAMHRGLGGVSDRAIEHLQAMEQRALWGPNHEQEDHR